MNMEYNGSKANLTIACLSLFPAISSILNLYFNHSQKNFYFDLFTSSFSLALLFIPFVLRNYKKLSSDFDYTMCTISSLVLISKFIFFSFTNPSFKFFLQVAFSKNNINLSIALLITIIIDILSASISNKTLAITYKILNAIGLMIFMIANVDLPKNNLFSTWLIFTIPSSIAILANTKKYKLTTVLCIIVYYAMCLQIKACSVEYKSVSSPLNSIFNFTKKFYV